MVGVVGAKRGKPQVPPILRWSFWILAAVIVFRASTLSSMLTTIHQSNRGEYEGLFTAPENPFTLNSPRNETKNHDENSATVDIPGTDNLPGAFVENKLFLLGARLTHSYQGHLIPDVHVDLFGFPGDFVHRTPRWNRRVILCPKDPLNLKSTALHYKHFERYTRLYCRVQHSKKVGHDDDDDGASEGDFSTPIPMILVPFISGDVNQKNNCLTWRCNITDYLNHDQLLERARGYISHNDDEKSGVRVQFLMQMAPEQYPFLGLFIPDLGARFSFFRDLREVATIEIPLDTGVLGHAGAHVLQPPPSTGREVSETKQGSEAFSSSSSSSYFLHPNRPLRVGLCTAAYGESSLDFMAEFIQHHANVGFHQIYIGIRGNAASPTFLEAQRRLKDYIDTGLLVLGYYGLPNEMKCNVELEKVYFYQMCLYHFKGLTKYAAVWDLDEFWLPPKQLPMDGRFNVDVFRYDVYRDGKEPHPTPPQFMARTNASDWSTFARVVREDPLWQESLYAKSVSFADTVVAIDNYYKEHGCGDHWCFHMFPSRITRLRNEASKSERTKRFGHDFHMRDVVDFSDRSHKGVVNTEKAFMAGYHWAGACRFDPIDPRHSHRHQKRLYHKYSNRSPQCTTVRMDFDVFGGMHHFYDLFHTRSSGIQPAPNTTRVPDEYVAHLSGPVNKQLDRRFASGGMNLNVQQLSSFRQTLKDQLRRR